MKIKFLYFFLLLFPLIAHAQTWKWERSISYGYLLASNVIVDKSGSSYFLTQDSSYFVDASHSVTIKIGDPSLVKISQDGSLVWKAPIHSLDPSWLITSYPYYGAINIAPDGNIVACGALPGALVFGSISLPADTKHPVRNNSNDKIWTQVFLAECDTNGTWQQASIIGATTTADDISGIVIDKNSNVNVAISYRDSLIVANVSYRANPYDTIKSYGLWYSTFIASFKINGQMNWGNNYPALQIPISEAYLTHLILDQNNNLSFVLQDALLTESIYKLRPNGNMSNIKIMPTQINDFRLDKYDNIFICGYIRDTVDFGNGIVLKGTTNGNGFLVKYDSSYKTLSGFTLSGSLSSVFLRIYLDKSGNLYTMGSFNGKLILGDSVYTNPTSIYGNYFESFFIAEYCANGSTIMKAILPYSNVQVPDFILDSSGMIIADWFVLEGNSFGPGFIELGCDTIYPGYISSTVVAKLDPRPPVISIIPFCTGDSLICISDTSQYHNWIWKFRNGTVLSGQRVAYNNPPSGTYHFGLYATNSVGCQVFVKDSFIHPLPPIAVFSTKDSIACEYTKLILNDISKTDTIAPGNWPQDMWSFGDGTNSKASKSAVKIYTDTGAFIVKLIYNNGFCATDTSINIRVISAPKPGFIVSDSAGCPPLTVKITPQTSGAITHTQYDFGNGQKDTFALPAVVYTMPGNYKILQQLTGPTGCITEDSANIHVRAAFSASKATDIANVTVVDSPLSLASQWLYLPGASVYNLYRYVDQDSSSAINITQTQYNEYFDADNIDPGAHTYTYYLTVSDSCGNTTTHGRVARTIRLTGILDDNLNPKLRWNPYLDWPRGVSGYVIFRKNSNGKFVQIAQTSDTNYTDTSFLANAIYNECYKIMAFDSFESNSNIFCFGNSPQIFIPNIFTPNGDTLNDLFAPVFSGIKSWRMDILNRWGERVYSSASPKPSPSGEGGGWDGNFKGQPASQGVYIYDIKGVDYYGNAVSKQGTVILQR